MNLYNSRNKVIGLFENKAISLSMYAYDAKIWWSRKIRTES